MAHEIKHGYRLSMCRMPGEPLALTGAPRVSVCGAGELKAEQGTAVLIGSPLADDNGFVTRSPVSGKVVSVGTGNGGGTVFEIENDFENKRIDAQSFGILTGKTASDMTYEDARDFIKSSGIIDGASGTPLWQLLEDYYGKADSLVINAVRCDRADLSESAYAVFKPEKLVGGMKILMIALGVRNGTVAISSCDQNRCDGLFDAIGREKMIKVASLVPKYPQSDPHLLVFAMTGRELSPLHKISKSGIAVISASSAVAVYDAFASGLAPNVRFFSAGTDKDAYLAEIEEGAPYAYIAGKLQLSGRAYINNVYSGKTLDEDGYINAGVENVFVTDLSEKKKSEFGCNKCAECVKVCPMYLFPYEFAYSGAKHARASGALVCIECGLCEYVCPSDVKLTDRIRTLKQMIKKGESAE